jgi:hypothetical protein
VLRAIRAICAIACADCTGVSGVMPSLAYHSVGASGLLQPAQLASTTSHATSNMLHPQQFTVNEAWVAFQLNDAPIHTGQEGTFNCLALMDAASFFILGGEFVPASAVEASELEFRSLLKKGESHKNELPKTLLLAREHVADAIEREAACQGISVVRVPESELLVFTSAARVAFREQFGIGG